MTDTLALRPTWQMTEQELMAEAEAINKADDKAALVDPAVLMRHLQPHYKRRQHLRIIGEQFGRLHNRDFDRLMILTPPQVGKTVTAAVGGAFWWLCLFPWHRVIIGSYGSPLAINRGRSVRKLVIEHGHRYDLRLEPGSQKVSDWELMSGGGLKSVGVGAGVTGSPGDIAIIDDPHKSRAEADSIRRRDAVHEWYSGDVISRLAPDAPVVLIMTPWHPDDLRGRLLADEGRVEDGGRWKVIAMPALCTDPDTDPLGRQLGEPLPHPKIAPRDKARALKHWEDKRTGSKVRDWFSLYQLDPKPEEGALLSRQLLRERRCYTQDAVCGPCCTDVVKAAVAVDPSGGGRSTAGIIGGYLGTDDRVYFTHDRSGVMDPDEWTRAACELAAEIDADLVIVEVNYGGKIATLAIRTAWDALRREELEQFGGDPRAQTYREQAKYARLAPRIKEVRARKNKVLRADPIAQQWIEDRCRTGAYLPEMEDEWATWQPDHTDSPGRIDASVYLGYGLLKPPSAGAGSGPPPTGTLPTTSSSPLAGGGGGTSSISPLG